MVPPAIPWQVAPRTVSAPWPLVSVMIMPIPIPRELIKLNMRRYEKKMNLLDLFCNNSIHTQNIITNLWQAIAKIKFC